MNAIELLTRVYAARHDAPDDDATARKILDAAAKQFELFGIQRTTMEDVARRAGVSRVTVYRRFPTKDQLLESVVRRDVQRFLTELAVHIEGLTSDEDRIVEGFVFTIGTLRRHTLLHRLLETEPELFLPQLTTGAGPMIAFARALIVDYARGRMPNVSDDELNLGAEVCIRVVLSLVVTPESVLDLEDTEGLRRLARHYAMPILDGRLLRLGREHPAPAKPKARRT
jgi:AcrR family transcriptional regulator